MAEALPVDRPEAAQVGLYPFPAAPHPVVTDVWRHNAPLAGLLSRAAQWHDTPIRKSGPRQRARGHGVDSNAPRVLRQWIGETRRPNPHKPAPIIAAEHAARNQGIQL